VTTGSAAARPSRRLGRFRWTRLASRHPARVVVIGFAGLSLVGVALLLLPGSVQDGRSVGFSEVVFTAVSAACVTGLSVVDTGSSWSGFGQLVILLLAQVGGIGIMTMVSAMVIVLGQRMGLAVRSLTRTETASLTGSQLRSVLRGVVLWSVAVEAVLAVTLTLRFATGYGMAWGTATWHGVFHSVMAFNNAGFALRADSLTPYAADWVVMVPVMAAIVIGGLGFPVLVELYGRMTGQDHRPRWSLHTKLTAWMSLLLVAVGTFAFTSIEWSNAGTLGPKSTIDKLLAGLFHSVSSRTAGFNTIDVGAMREDSWVFGNLLMFTGAGSAGTGGGIKVTTLAVLLLVFVSEARGTRDINALGRRIPDRVVRQAISVTIVSIGVVGGVATALLVLTPFPLDEVLFEAVSAFGTVGLSTGITPLLDTWSQYLVVFLMFFGRVGPATLSAALAMRRADVYYTYPEERPLVG
jgi:trk system potassium uptake protein